MITSQEGAFSGVDTVEGLMGKGKYVTSWEHGDTPYLNYPK